VKPTSPRGVSNGLSFGDHCKRWGAGIGGGSDGGHNSVPDVWHRAFRECPVCHGCGSPVEDGDTLAEYKQVTVLFADMVRSMDIAAAVGSERLREIMAELLDRWTAVVKRFGGTVDRFTGDGIMAVFGAPVALEEHAVRACLAALGIQNETVRLDAEVKDRDGIDLRLRVGLNSGQVIAGEVGSTSLGYTTIGEQVGMAQRMESVAPPGGVMLSAFTARLVDDEAVLGEPELVQIKGADLPVHLRKGLIQPNGAMCCRTNEGQFVEIALRSVRRRSTKGG
jgi:class 3 adenylate cyclase